MSLLQRRWGSSLGGLLTGAPLIAGPVLLALGLDYGAKFASDAAAGGLQAMTAVALYAAVYASAAARWKLRWAASLSVAFAAYAVVMGVIIVLPLNLMSSFLLTTAAQWFAIRSLPLKRDMDVACRTAPPWWDIPLRMVLAAILVWTVAAIGERVGARLSGLLTPFPIATTVLAVFTHRHDGPGAAAGFLRGLLFGMSSLAVFFAATAATLGMMEMTAAFVWSTLASLVTSAVLWLFSRPAAAVSDTVQEPDAALSIRKPN